jgi:hypothetical protein
MIIIDLDRPPALLSQRRGESQAARACIQGLSRGISLRRFRTETRKGGGVWDHAMAGAAMPRRKVTPC